MKTLEINSDDAVLKSALQSWWAEFSPYAPSEYTLAIVDLDSVSAPNSKEALTTSYTLPCDLPRPFSFEELEKKCKEAPAWTAPVHTEHVQGCEEEKEEEEEEESAKQPTDREEWLQGKARLRFENGQAFLDENALSLSALEFRMLQVLYESEEPVSARDLSLALWGKERASNQINVYINYLRKKTDLPHRERLIFTERRKGFYIKQ